MIRDAYGRPLSTFRVAVTERCNFRCVFCHSEGLDQVIDELATQDYEVIADATSRLGIKYVKFTGGEPLLRKDLEDVIRLFKKYGYKEISLTTNGFLLSERALSLKEAGLNWVNVSLHSLKEERFKVITGVPALKKVIRGIEKAKDVGLDVRINVVVMKDVNEDEILDIVRFAIERDISVHVIELHPVGRGAQIFKYRHSSKMKDVVEWLERVADKKEIRPLHNRPRYLVGRAFVELVEPVGNPYFCSGCSRLRLSPDGKFYPCINVSHVFFDSLSILRSSRTYEEKVNEIMAGILDLNDLRKPYYMWSLDFEKKKFKNVEGVSVRRLDLPKRAKLQFLRELRSAGTLREAKLRDSPLRV